MKKSKTFQNHSKIAWHSFNYRRKKKGLSPLSFEKWVSMRESTNLDALGRFNPRMQPTLKKMEKQFGKKIYTEKKKCIRCGKKKFLYEFVARYDGHSPGIQNFCRACERSRLKKYSHSQI